MCLNPTIILNPAYSQHRHEFRYLSLNGRIIEQDRLADGFYYPKNLPPFRTLDLGLDALERYFALDDQGVVTRIFMPVPCNKCLECIESKRSAIRVRMLLEQMSHGCPPVFITLTYNDSNLPPDGVSREDVKRFLNRLHLYLGRSGYPTYFRHIVVSEYGSLNGRPHYHGILYGLDWIDTPVNRIEFFKILEKSWGKGFVRYDIVHGRAFSYVSKYIGKDVACDVVKGRNPDFWTASRRDGGLGSSICNSDSFLELCSTPHFPTIQLPVEDRVYEVTLPSYIRDKILPPLSKYISRRVRDAYVQFKKDLIVLKSLELPFDRLCRSLVHPDLKSFINLSVIDSKDSEISTVYSVLTFFGDFSRIESVYDPILSFYYGSDEYWKLQYRHLPKHFDCVQLFYRLLFNYDILNSSLPDVPFILTQLHARERVSKRFSLRVEKWQSTLPPSDQRALLLLHKNIKDFQNRYKDSQ